MDRKDFSKWIMGSPDWKEVAFKRNTGKEFQHKQDLVAVFGNAYRYFEEKVELYFEEFKELPITFLEDLIFKFRKSFPTNDRVAGVNYFDDLLELLINKYSKSLVRKKANKYSQPAYGLLHHYLCKTGEGVAINDDNKDKIAKEYGFDSPTSGVALRNEFNKHKSNTTRLNLSGVKITDSTMRNTFTQVIEILTEHKNLKSLSLADDEYLIFNNKFQKHYL
jgi:hypothetical protein